MRIKKIISSTTLLLALTVPIFLGSCNTTSKAMDIVSPGFNLDDNFLLKNPTWAVRTTDPKGAVPFPSTFCPCNSGNPADWNSAANCTNQSVQYVAPSGVNSLFCGDGGHMNYFPVTYECNVCWNDHSNEDDDYNFRLHRADSALYTAGWDGFLQGEFDSDETVDNWDDTNTWWDDFHHNKVDDSHEAAANALDGKFAIVIGEAGIDFEHGCHIELHPIYAMFVHVNDDPNDDRWAFFIRNWGNEGYCGNSQVNYQSTMLETNTIRVRIPHESAKNFIITHQNIQGINNNNNILSVDASQATDGVILTFHLDAPEAHSTIVGDLSFLWLNPGSHLQPRHDADSRFCLPDGLGESDQPLSTSSDNEIDSLVYKLDPQSRKELLYKVKEQFNPKRIVNKTSLSINKTPLIVKKLAHNELKKINYSTMIYYTPDSTSAIRKNQRATFIKEYLRGKIIK